MFIEERHQAILKKLEEEGSITTSAIQRAFGIGYDSAKRDLRILEEKGLLQRTHGGAIPVRQVAYSRPKDETCRDFPEVKKNYLAVAREAVKRIRENDVVFISAATVGFFMVQNLPEELSIRVATNSIVMAEELRKKKNISVILLGGEMDGKGNCYDTLAVEMLRKLRFDKCFLTSACISAEFGLSIQRSQGIAFWNAVMDSSREVIGLYPAEKIGGDSIVSICPAERLDEMITDWNASQEKLVAFEDKGIEVFVVDEE